MVCTTRMTDWTILLTPSEVGLLQYCLTDHLIAEAAVTSREGQEWVLNFINLIYESIMYLYYERVYTNMMKRENMISLLRRKGYNEVPVSFSLCPYLQNVYREKEKTNLNVEEYFGFSSRGVEDARLDEKSTDTNRFKKYYDYELKEGTKIDIYGVAREPGSESCMHLTRMHHPLKTADSVEQILEYPMPDFNNADYSHQKDQVEKHHKEGYFVIGGMQTTIWEKAWYIRSMEELMMDMMSDDEKAVVLLDKVTETACARAENYAKAGVDMIFLGDDIGMQKTIMMSESLYVDWLKPRLRKVIQAAKQQNPDVIIAYHSCGYVKPFIQHLIEVDVDVLNPVQPECMDFKEIHDEFGDRISFFGTIGTQTTMPFGTPEDIRKEVFRNLKIAGEKGGLWISPTHLLEPEVPWENVMAYVQACRDFLKS